MGMARIGEGQMLFGDRLRRGGVQMMFNIGSRRARGEQVDEGEIERAGHAALQAIVPKQIEAGIDIGNNGEQQREGFFLHVRHRMSGFGGSWKRWPRADVERYPVFKRAPV
jgi:5-methyltetrahydropteroyltriglutamate--homocysteine methyltransferase